MPSRRHSLPTPQLRAPSAAVIHPAELLPGDAIFSYARAADSPGHRHNHVSLFVGTDGDGVEWAIESRENAGAVLVELNKVAFAGGVRRFCPEPLGNFSNGPWSWLVRRVPKLGRLGARLTAQYGSGDRHRGTDIYVAMNSPVASPVSGSIVALEKTSGGKMFVDIWSPDACLRTLIGPVLPAATIRVGMDIAVNEFLGLATYGPGPGGCNVIKHSSGSARIHWELWAPHDLGFSPAPALKFKSSSRLISGRDSLMAHNVIYALKRGTVGSPLAVQR